MHRLNRLAVLSLMLATGCSVEAFEPSPAHGPQDDAGYEPPEASTMDHGDAGRDSGSVGHGDGGAEGAPSADAALDVQPDVPMCVCTGDLSYAGTDDLLVSVTVATTAYPTAPGYGAILNQRKTCDAANPGWELWMNPDGTITFQAYDGGSVFNNVTNPTPVPADGMPHIVSVTRSNTGTDLFVTVDTNYVHGTDFPGQTPMNLAGKLTPLQQGVDPVCATNAAEPAEPFPGAITGVCVAIACPKMQGR